MQNANERFTEILNRTPEREYSEKMFKLLFSAVSPNLSEDQFVDLVVQSCPQFKLVDTELEYHRVIWRHLSTILRDRADSIDLGFDPNDRMSKIEVAISDIMNDAYEHLQTVIAKENKEFLDCVTGAIHDLLDEGKENLERMKETKEKLDAQTEKWFKCKNTYERHGQTIFLKNHKYLIKNDSDMNEVILSSEAFDNYKISRSQLKQDFEPVF